MRIWLARSATGLLIGFCAVAGGRNRDDCGAVVGGIGDPRAIRSEQSYYFVAKQEFGDGSVRYIGIESVAPTMTDDQAKSFIDARKRADQVRLEESRPIRDRFGLKSSSLCNEGVDHDLVGPRVCRPSGEMPKESSSPVIVFAPTGPKDHDAAAWLKFLWHDACERWAAGDEPKRESPVFSGR